MINWQNVRLVYWRELRDQLRDRRTLFTIAVLPLMLYPLMGMALMQVAQFMKENPSRIWVVGAEDFANDVALVSDGKFDQRWCSEAEQNLMHIVDHNDKDALAVRLELHKAEKEASKLKSSETLQAMMLAEKIDLVLVLPTDFDKLLPNQSESANDALVEFGTDTSVPQMVSIVVNTSSENSTVGAERVRKILYRWKEGLVNQNLESVGLPITTVEPFEIHYNDVASRSGKKAALWSKIMPFVVMIWALTGAFYPAIDLVAGEKERGTLETLLTSPAKRIELVVGKLLTVMSFSMCTSLLNLASMGFTGLIVMGQLSNMSGMAGGFDLGTPPMAAMLWLVLGLIPVSAMFSALALAVASFAKSSKEGQYYLIPLLIMTLPLMMLPMMPGTQLDLGMSFIPVTGMMLLLKGLIEGQWMESARYVAPVVMVTCVGCWLSIRWAVHQFNSESVLFRESERFGLGIWIKHLMRERGPLPTIGEALLCGLIILLVKFFVSFAAQVPTGWGVFAQQTLIVLVSAIAIPAVLMAMVLTRAPRQSLKLTMPQWWTIPAAFCVAVLLHPAMMFLTHLVIEIYPPSQNLAAFQTVINDVLGSAPNIFAILAVMALAPAIAEELAFRGFILSGLQKLNNKIAAILVTSLFFAAAHGVVQQSMMAFVTGTIIGIVAVQTRSILPCIVYHATHNGASILMSQLDEVTIANSSVLSMVFDYEVMAEGQIVVQYAPWSAIIMIACGIILFSSLFRIRHTASQSAPVGSPVAQAS